MHAEIVCLIFSIATKNKWKIGEIDVKKKFRSLCLRRTTNEENTEESL